MGEFVVHDLLELNKVSFIKRTAPLGDAVLFDYLSRMASMGLRRAMRQTGRKLATSATPALMVSIRINWIGP